MKKYILLRDNKENGPFTLEELAAKGLKPYDLIWIEGRSAGWRYPSEIEELKPFAPVVEEQPYDRFYKKPTTETVIPKEETTNAVRTPNQNIIEEPNFKATVKIPIAATKKIYVTFPSEGIKPVFIETEKQKPLEQKVFKEKKPEPIINDEPVVLEEKYSRPLDEIKKLYVNNILQQKKKSLGRIVINEKIKLAVFAFTLLLSGTAVGLFINRNKSGTEKIIAANIPEQKVINTAAQMDGAPINNTQTAIIKGHPTNENEQKAINKKKEEKLIPKTTISKNTEIIDAARQPATVNQKQSTIQTSAKENISGIEEDEQKAIARKNLGKEINITASNYKKATFGGISNLEFTVYNNTNYTIDMVIAEVDYYTASKKIYKTETVYFKNIAPNGSQVQQAPNSNRGYEVKYRISLISSKELGIYTAGL